MIRVYGIANCDKVRAARKWLAGQGLAHAFHDVRTDGLAPDRLVLWIDRLGREALVNRRSTTWRRLSEAERVIEDDDTACALLIRHPTLIRRPVIEIGDAIIVGFGADERRALARAIEAGGDKG